MADEKKYAATLSGRQLWELFVRIGWTYHQDRYTEKCLNQAHMALTGILKAEYDLQGNVKGQVPTVTTSYDFTKDVLFGVKATLVQALLRQPNQARPAEDFNGRKMLLETADAFGTKFALLVRKEAGLDEVPEEKPAFDIDEIEIAAPGETKEA